jgi:hypothetical protein
MMMTRLIDVNTSYRCRSASTLLQEDTCRDY